MDPAKIGVGNNIPEIDFFKKETYKDGYLEKTLDKAVNRPVDHFQSGQWKAEYKSSDILKYRNTLGGLPVASYDPHGFLKELGLSDKVKAPGRTSIQMTEAFNLVDYKPDPTYFPGPRWLASPVQKGFLLLGGLSPKALNVIDTAATKTVISKMEKPDTLDPNPFGKEEEIKKVEKLTVSPSERYYGVSRNQNPGQFAWGEGVHTGSIAPDLKNNEKFGTYDIALKMGFTDEQARNISLEDYDVDTNETHYPGENGHEHRITHSGTGGHNGDLHWHYNRSKPGEEDSRITSAKTHLERAVKLSKEGYYQAAERELGIGLHSLQDMFSHGQITPINHTLLGEFPDFVKWNPVGMYETALATEGYLKKYTAMLDISPVTTGIPLKLKTRPLADSLKTIYGVSQEKQPVIGKIVTGDADTAKQLQVASMLNSYPQELLELLDKNKVKVFVADKNTSATDIGFGTDLDKDGKITPEKWLDVNQDNQKQGFETEGSLPDGRSWNEQKACYHEPNKVIYLSDKAFQKSGELEDILKHEVKHAIDSVLRNDPQLKEKWINYTEKLYDAGRRKGEIAFDEVTPREYFADK